MSINLSPMEIGLQKTLRKRCRHYCQQQQVCGRVGYVYLHQQRASVIVERLVVEKVGAVAPQFFQGSHSQVKIIR